MGYPLRDFPPGCWFHIKQNSIANRAVFATNLDRFDFVARCEKYAPRYGVKIISIRFAVDHFHLILEPDSAEGIPRMMQAVVGSYSRAFNRRYDVRAGLPDTETTKFQNFGTRYHASEIGPSHIDVIDECACHNHESCNKLPELPQNATREQLEKRVIIAALILAIKWSRSFWYALVRLNWWEGREQHRLERRRLRCKGPPGRS
jgi:REP element-mobilizing transposase RayT